jgi:hypothetical protein
MSSAATGKGHVKSAQELNESPNTPKHHYETRFVTPNNNCNRLSFKRSKATIKMETPNQWPCWTACISPLAYAQLGHFYFKNVGFRHKPVVNLKKTSTNLLYQVESDQGWECRTIVWTSPNFNPFNRPNNPSGIMDNSEEYEITPFMGTL